MRVQLSSAVVATLRRLGADGLELRRRIEALKRTPKPPDALDLSERPGRYEFFVRTGAGSVWVQCELLQDRGESVVRMTAIEAS
jgi:hypothetical protein